MLHHLPTTVALIAVSLTAAPATGLRTHSGDLVVPGVYSTTTRDSLPRRPFLGAILADPPAAAGLSGVMVHSVFPGYSAERSGLQAGDVMLSLDGHAAASVPDVLQQLRARRSGDRLEVVYVRAGERRQLTLALTEMPRETYADIDVIYGELLVDGARRRTIVTKPKDAPGPLPTVLLAPGLGCYSMDVPVVEPGSYTLLMNELTRRGYATMPVFSTRMVA